MLHSISDLTTFCRKTTGDVPPKLVGASTTVVGTKMYLFGGRLVTERRMVSDLYMFDLDTLHWTKLLLPQDENVPRARYFHSADTWNGHLVVFGGMSNKLDSINPDDLCVLDDVRLFDLSTHSWLPAQETNSQGPSQPLDSTEYQDPLVPRARYAHLSSITGDRLFIIGGQDFFNVWLDDVCVFDLQQKLWVLRQDYPRHCGTYRSVAVSASMCVRNPQQDEARHNISASLGPSGTRFMGDKTGQPVQGVTPSDGLVHLPYSVQATRENPSDIFLYSNYNFTDVKRELETFSPEPSTPTNASPSFSITDCSNSMKGNSLPPGLRFPTGAVLGNHFIIAGTYLAHTYQSFSIWALDLTSMTWSRIDPGSAMSTGSWARGCLYVEANKFMVFGNRNGNLVDDYTRRLLSWDHVAVVDLEAFGIYQPPPLSIDLSMHELGLAALEEAVTTDFEIVCDDGRRVACSRKVLEARWPWFKEQRRKFVQLALQTIEQLPPSGAAAFTRDPLPSLPGESIDDEDRPDPRLTPRSLQLSEPYPITLALLQYFYSQALLTPLQHAPAVLSQLLVLSSTYNLTHLQTLVRHAMHRALSNSTSVGVYEVATLCSCRSLQIRALKTVMSYSQKRPSKPKSSDNQGDRNDGGDGGRYYQRQPGAGPDPNASMTSRPRGTSDAHWRGGGAGGMNNGGRAYGHGPIDFQQALAKLSFTDDPEEDDEYSNDAPSTSPSPILGSRQNDFAATTSSSSSRSPSPPEEHQRFSGHARKLSVSTIVDDELCAVAELMTPGATSRHKTPSPKSSGRRVDMDRPDMQRARTEPSLPLPEAPVSVKSAHLSFTSISSYYRSASDNDHESDDLPYLRSPKPTPTVFPDLRRRPSTTPSSSSSLASASSSPSAAAPPVTPLSSVFSHAQPTLVEQEENQQPQYRPLSIDEESIYSQAPTASDPAEWTHEPKAQLMGKKLQKQLDMDLPAFSRPGFLSDALSSSSRSPPSSPGYPASPPASSATLAKFFGKKDRSLTSPTPGLAPGGPEFASLDPKQAKEDSRKRKKAEAKIRKQRLADDLKRRKDAAGEVNSNHSSEDRKSMHKTSDGVASMYGSNFGLLGL